MLDPFLRALSAHEKTASDEEALASSLSHLPAEQLFALAVGGSGVSSESFEQMKVAMQKRALGAELLNAAKGVASFAKRVAPGLQKAYSAKGLGGVATAARGFGAQGLRQAGQWAVKNPGAAATIGAAGVAGAAGAGYLAGQ